VDALVIPVAPVSAPASHTEVYRARRGDSLVTIADRFGVSLEDLHRWNHAIGAGIVAGQRIRVAEPAHVASRSREKGPASAAHEDKTKAKHASKSAAKPSSASSNKSTPAAAKKPSSKPTSKKHEDAEAHKSGDTKKNKAPSQNASNKKLQK
jgi:membrane-bound lytic murein transglycosylase D